VGANGAFRVFCGARMRSKTPKRGQKTTKITKNAFFLPKYLVNSKKSSTFAPAFQKSALL
jgi:hypothetical protein